MDLGSDELDKSSVDSNDQDDFYPQVTVRLLLVPYEWDCVCAKYPSFSTQWYCVLHSLQRSSG